MSTYDCFAELKPERVVNLAAQAGVRYSDRKSAGLPTAILLGLLMSLKDAATM